MSPERRGRRRLWWVAGGLVTVLLLIVAAAWFWWLPSYRPGLRRGERYGVDVSGHQGHIDWRRVAGDHISFAYIKATEGETFVDARFADNWAGAKAAGVARGAYHFFTLCTPGVRQAAHFLDVLSAGPADLAPAVDLELAGNCRDRPSAAALASELDAFLATVETSTGRIVVVYLGDDFADRYPVPATQSRPLWLRRFLQHPANDRWTIWQVDGYARVSGIRGSVDLDVMRGP